MLLFIISFNIKQFDVLCSLNKIITNNYRFVNFKSIRICISVNDSSVMSHRILSPRLAYLPCDTTLR